MSGSFEPRVGVGFCVACSFTYCLHFYYKENSKGYKISCQLKVYKKYKKDYMLKAYGNHIASFIQFGRVPVPFADVIDAGFLPR